MTNRHSAHDDSTLFRLDDLVAIATTTPKPAAGPSEPLDIAPALIERADFTPTPAVLAPAPPKRSNHRMAALVGGFAVVAISTTALAAAVVVKYSQPQPRPMMAQVRSDLSKPMFVTPPRARVDAPRAQVVVPTVERDDGEARSTSTSRSKTTPLAKLPTKTKTKTWAAARVKTARVATTKAKAAKASTGGDPELNKLINSIGAPSDSKRKAARAKAAVSSLPKTLERSQIQRVMRTQVFGAVARCYERFHVPGFVHTKITIGREGKAQARIRGRFARTPTGSCVGDAVRRATFPPFSGAPISVSYPFRLR